MRISKINSSLVFGRKLHPSEEAEYSYVLNKAREKASGGNGKRVLIVPASSLPQSASNNTGVGNLASSDGQKFFDFAKKYWGINEIQLLPTGQYHFHNGEVPIYSGTTMDLGNHMINTEEILQTHSDDFQKVVKANNISERVNFINVIDLSSKQEKMLKKLYKNMPSDLKQEFKQYKNNAEEIIERKALYRALRFENNSYDYKRWPDLDRDLFTEDVIGSRRQKERIRELYRKRFDDIDFYKFKQFLADKSLKHAKETLNSKGIKLCADIPCGFSFDEVWSYPEAFYDPYTHTMGWDLPALKLGSKEGKDLLRQKVRFYANRFDGFRLDASWTYVVQRVHCDLDGKTIRNDYGDEILNLIENEVKRVKGNDFDLSNIMHEFSASRKDFSLYRGDVLRPEVKNRVKIYTSDGLSEHWGSNSAFLERGWDRNSFILGAVNHDSHRVKVNDEQVRVLSKILKIPEDKLKNPKEFMKAKWAEPMSALNNMIFFMPALGIEGKYKDNRERKLNYTTKIPENYEEYYFKALEDGRGFNPMDALEKSFVAQGLDKTDKKLFKKIVKFRKILEEKEGSVKKMSSINKNVFIGISAITLTLSALSAYLIKEFQKSLVVNNSSNLKRERNIQ